MPDTWGCDDRNPGGLRQDGFRPKSKLTAADALNMANDANVPAMATIYDNIRARAARGEYSLWLGPQAWNHREIVRKKMEAELRQAGFQVSFRTGQGQRDEDSLTVEWKAP